MKLSLAIKERADRPNRFPKRLKAGSEISPFSLLFAEKNYMPRAAKKWTSNQTATVRAEPLTLFAAIEFVRKFWNFQGLSPRKIAIVLSLALSLSLFSGCQKEVGGPGGASLPPRHRIPDSRLAAPIAQLQWNWCWAASAEMILYWRGHRVSQCDQANLYRHDGGGNCCPESPDCDRGQIPDKSFAPGKTDYKRYRFKALPELVLQEEIASDRPVIFSWRDCEKNCGPTLTGHMMVLVGYEVKDGHVVFDVLDPYPPHEGGQIPIVTYKQFVAFQAGKSHWDDFYAFKDGKGSEYH